MTWSHKDALTGFSVQARERTGSASRSELAAAKRAADEREVELRRGMREGEAKLRERISRLDEDNQELRRSGRSLLDRVHALPLKRDLADIHCGPRGQALTGSTSAGDPVPLSTTQEHGLSRYRV